MIQVAQGRLSKQIAADMGITETTVKVHRSNLMRKMKAGSLPELGRMAGKLSWCLRNRSFFSALPFSQGPPMPVAAAWF